MFILFCYFEHVCIRVYGFKLWKSKIWAFIPVSLSKNAHETMSRIVYAIFIESTYFSLNCGKWVFKKC